MDSMRNGRTLGIHGVSRRTVLVVVVVGLLGARALLPRAYDRLISSYERYMELGRGWLPYNAFGWLINEVILRPIAIHRKNIYNISNLKGEKTLNLPVRHGPRPITDGIAPHRQITQKSTSEQFNKMCEILALISQQEGKEQKENEKTKITLGVSKVGKSGPAIFVGNVEVAHIHESDYSLHVNMSQGDAKEVIEKGWGEKHRIAGLFGISKALVMVYGPRDDDELQVIEKISRAAVAYYVSVQSPPK